MREVGLCEPNPSALAKALASADPQGSGLLSVIFQAVMALITKVFMAVLKLVESIAMKSAYVNRTLQPWQTPLLLQTLEKQDFLVELSYLLWL
ncbi:hypothetical protein J6590_015060 [Homalodisca vitripennis]|nr:hypothetical protein J6590_015060 [Homalodisca vitripennis]